MQDNRILEVIFHTLDSLVSGGDREHRKNVFKSITNVCAHHLEGLLLSAKTCRRCPLASALARGLVTAPQGQQETSRVSRRSKLYEGKAKILYEGPEPGTLIQYFKDDATAFNNQKKATLSGKGVLNNHISEHIFKGLTTVGVTNHFIRRLSMREQLIKSVEIIPLEVIVRNVAAGTLSKRLGLEEGTDLPRPLVEYCYKSDELGDPLIAEDHILTFGWANEYELDDILSTALRVNDFLSGLFCGIGIRLVDFKLEFGRLYEGDEYMTILADEISPDSCRLWDMETGEKLDKDRFRRDLGGEMEAYSEVARRLGILPSADVQELSEHRKKR